MATGHDDADDDGAQFAIEVKRSQFACGVKSCDKEFVDKCSECVAFFCIDHIPHHQHTPGPNDMMTPRMCDEKYCQNPVKHGHVHLCVECGNTFCKDHVPPSKHSTCNDAIIAGGKSSSGKSSATMRSFILYY